MTLSMAARERTLWTAAPSSRPHLLPRGCSSAMRPLPSWIALRGARAHLHAYSSGAFGCEGSRGNSGNPRLHVARAVEAVKAEAERYAANVLPIIREAQKAGARTRQEIAEALNARGIATACGGQWYAHSVANVLPRAYNRQAGWGTHDRRRARTKAG